MGTTRTDVMQSIAALPALAGLDRELVARLAGIRPLALQAGAYLFRDGEPSTDVHLLLDPSGSLEPVAEVEFRSSLLSKARLSYRLPAGAFAGAVEMLLSGLSERLPARVCATRALRDCLALPVPAALAAAIAEADPAFRRRFIREAAQAVTGALQGHASLGATHPDLRFATALLDLLDEFGQRLGNRGRFARRIRQQELAERLGISARLLSLRLSDWSSRGLVETVPLALPDLSRLERLAALGGRDLAANVAAAIADIEGFIAQGLLVRASQSATDFLAVFPGNPLAAYLLALIASRLDAREDAEAVMQSPFLAWPGTMGELKQRLRAAWRRSLAGAAGLADPHGTEEERLESMLTRRLNELAIDVCALRARLAKDGARDLPPRSQQFRAAAMRAAGFYRDIHEASPNHFCAVNAATLARAGGGNAYRDLAREAERLASRESGYWASASRGEAALLQDDVAAARAHFAAAVAAHDADRGRIAATRRQLDLLQLAGADVSELRTILDAGRPLALLGGMDAGTPERDGPAALGSETLSGLWLAPGSAAALAAAEAADARAVPIHVLLPFPIEAVEELAGERLPGPDLAAWRRRFYAVLEAAVEVRLLWHRLPPRGEIAAHLQELDLRLAGEAIAAGLALDEQAAVRRLSEPGAPPDGTPFTQLVFAFARNRVHNDALRGMARSHGFETRMLRDGRLALHRSADGHAAARHAALRLGEAAHEAGIGVRIVLDHGPVRGRDGHMDVDALTRLEGAGDATELMIGDIFATPAFALSDLALGGAPRRYGTLGFGVDGDDRRGGISGRRRFFRVRP